MQKSIPTRRDPWARWAKIIFAIVVCATLLALAGCTGKDAYREMLLVEEETGCQYLGYVADGGLSTAHLRRRIGADGKQVCK